jgi:hypothetical protein
VPALDVLTGSPRSVSAGSGWRSPKANDVPRWKQCRKPIWVMELQIHGDMRRDCQPRHKLGVDARLLPKWQSGPKIRHSARLDCHLHTEPVVALPLQLQRKLCEGEGKDLSIPRQEAEEWQACFLAWFGRVKRHFAEEVAGDFLANAEDDFRVILECSSKMPEFMWREDVDKRFIMVEFANQAARDAANVAADQKYPVKLGSALQQYLMRCAAQLVGDDAVPPSNEPKAAATRPAGLEMRFLPMEDSVSLLIERFECFDTPEDVAQDIVTTAYNLEAAVRNYLLEQSPKVLKRLQFDCESSTFVVRSADMQALSTVVEAILEMSRDAELYRTHRG